jgi:Domain of unknown function (DUF4190)
VSQAPPPPPSYPELPPGAAYPGYQPPGFPVQQRTNGTAIGALITGIASFFLGWFCCLIAPVGGIVAIVLGRRARREIRMSGGYESGEGIATAGEVIGWIVTALGVLGLLLALVILTLIVVGNDTKNVFQDISNGLSSPPP